jgi:hypothetical protein
MQAFATEAGIQPSITWLNMTGDVTITWDEQNKEAVLELVRAKMKQGYTFFIWATVKPRPSGRGYKVAL